MEGVAAGVVGAAALGSIVQYHVRSASWSRVHWGYRRVFPSFYPILFFPAVALLFGPFLLRGARSLALAALGGTYVVGSVLSFFVWHFVIDQVSLKAPKDQSGFPHDEDTKKEE